MLGIVTWLLMWVLLFLVLSVLGKIGGFSIEQIGAGGPGPLVFIAVLLTQVGFALIATCYRLIMEAPAAVICKALMQDDAAPFAGQI